MQKYREIFPHRFEAQAFHLRLIGTDHDPVAVASRLAKQGIADCAANEIDLHRYMMPDAVRESKQRELIVVGVWLGLGGQVMPTRKAQRIAAVGRCG
ncbi:hypothetical protein XHV734_0948 [Xanthomonas hortorum pv. vitians]|nr:hypothetical protein XGA_3025 [Xanthomonas hortorum ATCC 19865]QNM59783.1 hypothetical protein XHV734_0948 [Xanthomonas hortorum pv. vitians]